MTSKNPQFGGKIILKEEVGSGVYGSDDLNNPLVGFAQGPGGSSGAVVDVDQVTTQGIDLGSPLSFASAGVTSITGPGAISPESAVTAITTTGADAFTLADTEGGTVIYVYLDTDGGDATITPTNLLGYSTITLNDEGDAVQLFFSGDDWVVLSSQGATLA